MVPQVRRFWRGLAGVVALLGATAPADAALVHWSIDSSQSYMRLNIPDQVINVEGFSTTLRMRDAASNASWTDNGGRRASLGGLLTTNYHDGASIQFLPGLSHIVALEGTNLRPNPAAFSPAATSPANPDGMYTDSSSAPAAFGARVRATVLTTTVDSVFLAFRDVLFELESGVVPLGGGTTIAAGTTEWGMPSAGPDVDGISTLLLGEWIPDYRALPVSLPNASNSATGTVTDLGPYLRQLTLAVNVPFEFDVEDVTVTGFINGQVVAHLMIPEPSSVLLLGVGAGVVGIAARRHRRRRYAAT